MKLLFIDTSAKTAKVFVTEEGTLLSERSDDGEKTHASMLLPMIDEALKEAGLRTDEIDVIGVTNGPGSYTGLRIGLACGKMLAYGARKPLVTVNTLDYLALSAVSLMKEPEKDGGCVLAMLDARNTLCFYGIYSVKEKGAESLSGVRSEYAVDIVKDVLGRGFSGNQVFPYGDGAVKNVDALKDAFGNDILRDIPEMTGNYTGALRAVEEKMRKANDMSCFDPSLASAEYFKEVHITLRSGEK